MTVVVVTHELASAFRIADRIAMLYNGTFLAVGTKDEIRVSQNPHIRQFLDRVPDTVATSHVVESFMEKYLRSSEVTP
jgi:phospholipid/cholesterol/gamma-HCH transport system ATP-binding protein